MKGAKDLFDCINMPLPFCKYLLTSLNSVASVAKFQTLCVFSLLSFSDTPQACLDTDTQIWSTVVSWQKGLGSEAELQLPVSSTAQSVHCNFLTGKYIMSVSWACQLEVFWRGNSRNNTKFYVPLHRWHLWLQASPAYRMPRLRRFRSGYSWARTQTPPGH